ncbi:DUF6923 family protein [Umezawaea endophytica]|uniref:DUF6923 domain-containing protein n=1 Tax=Umezawaea endophytica TaxID=1654476 RepID=A0A9X2VW37_9PSEU|nr:hypothetical protein [Umezawaea endophytica]MCS7483933.1 hypothetical protein [Umezawaea endophytica]
MILEALTCVVLQVEAVSANGPSTLYAVELPSGTATPVAVLDERLNALAYSAERDVYYGISPEGRVIEVDRQGTTTDVGRVPHPGLAHAVAGAIHGDHFYLRADGAVYIVDVNPASPDFLGLVQARVLWPFDVFLSVDDFDYNPADGLLYGVATRVFGHPEVVTIDPYTGHVHPLGHPPRLPDGPGYGAAVLGPDGALYASNNDEGGQSTLYRVPLDGAGEVTRLAERPAARTIDSAGCHVSPPTPEPPAPTTTTPPPTTTVPPTTTTVLPTTPRQTSPQQTTPQQTTPRPTTTSADSPPTTTTAPEAQAAAAPNAPPPITTASPPTPPQAKPRPVFEVDRPVEEVVVLADRGTETKRRWSLAVLLLVIGAGAVASQRARRG